MQITAAPDGPLVARLRLAFVGLALMFLLAPLAASAPLVDPDEGLHAAIAQEMLLRHEYVTPTFLGQPFLDKPILFFWAEALSLRLLGMNEAAVRLPALLFGLLGMVTVALFARTVFGEVSALLAGIIYASMLLPLGVSEVAVHDVALIPFMCIAALGLWRSAESPRPWMWGLPIGFSLGASILTKGLVGVVFVGMLAVCFSVLRRESVAKVAIALVVAGPITLAVAAPWYLAMERAHSGYLYYYFIERHLQGYMTATQRHAGRPWWYYVPILIGGALPWTGYLAGAVRMARARQNDFKARARLVLWVWFGVGLVFLSAGESKLVTYVLPLFPALALILADYISLMWAPPSDRVTVELAHSRLFRYGLATQVIVLVALPALAVVVEQTRFHAQSIFMWIAAALAVPLTLIPALTAWRARTLDGFVMSLTRAIALSFLVLALVIAPRAVRWMTARDLAAELNRLGALPSHVAVLDERIGSLIFYLSPPLRADATSDRIATTSRSLAIERLRVDAPDAIVAVRDDELQRFQRLFSTQPTAYARAGTFTLFRVEQLRAALEPLRR
jgi:4-amino-4-deoxy-L-arabinose transferase-like glycosyltransferase